MACAVRKVMMLNKDIVPTVLTRTPTRNQSPITHKGLTERTAGGSDRLGSMRGQHLPNAFRTAVRRRLSSAQSVRFPSTSTRHGTKRALAPAPWASLHQQHGLVHTRRRFSVDARRNQGVEHNDVGAVCLPPQHSSLEGAGSPCSSIGCRDWRI